MALDVDRHHWFKTVILPEEPALLARLRRILRSCDEVEDAAAEALAKAYATTDYARITAGRAYLFQIARNALIDQARRTKIVSFSLVADLDLFQVDHGFERSLQARDELRRTQAIIDTLPTQRRRAFILRRVHQYSVAEIAEEMNLSVSTVEKHLGKAVVHVVRALREGEELSGTRIDNMRAEAADRGGSSLLRR